MKPIRGVLSGVLAVALLVAVPAARALDDRHIKDIDRAETMSDLLKLASDITKSQAARKPADNDEAKRIAMDTEVYLQFIRVKQDAILSDQLKALLEKEPSGFLPDR